MLLKETGKVLKRKAKAAAQPVSSIRRMATAFLILGLSLGITGFILFMRTCIQRNRVPAEERTPVSPAPWTKALNFLQRGRADSSSTASGAPSGMQMQLLASLFSGTGTSNGSRPPSLSREASGMTRGGYANQVPLRWPTASAMLFVLFGYTSVCIALLCGLALVSSLQLSSPQLGWTAFLSCTLLTFVLLEALFLAILVRATGQSSPVPPQPVTSLPFTQVPPTSCRPASGSAPSTSRDLPPIFCEVAAYALLLAQGAGLAVMGSPLLSTHTSTLRTIMYYSYVIMALLALFTLALLRLPASWQARDLRAPGSQQVPP